MPSRTKTGTTRADLNEIKLEVSLAIKDAVEPLVAKLNRHEQTLYGENGDSGLNGSVKRVAADQEALYKEFNAEKNKLKGVAAVLSAIGAGVGVAASFAAKALSGK